MTTQEIQRAMAAKPFEPFGLTVADGNSYVVRHRENLAFSGKGRLIAIGMEDDSFVTLDLLLVTGLQKPIRRQTQRSRR
jgi:hypothetical protein